MGKTGTPNIYFILKSKNFKTRSNLKNYVSQLIYFPDKRIVIQGISIAYKGQLVAERQLRCFLFISTLKILNIYYYKILEILKFCKTKRVNKHHLFSYAHCPQSSVQMRQDVWSTSSCT